MLGLGHHVGTWDLGPGTWDPGELALRKCCDEMPRAAQLCSYNILRLAGRSFMKPGTKLQSTWQMGARCILKQAFRASQVASTLVGGWPCLPRYWPRLIYIVVRSLIKPWWTN